MKIGAHCTTAGGLLSAIKKAQEIGAECIQIFSSAPQQWNGPVHSASAMHIFQDACAQADLTPVFIHGTYLVNLASEKSELRDKSIHCLIRDMEFASSIHATGVIFHFGSRVGGWKEHEHELVPEIEQILGATPPDTNLIIENSAGTGNTIGSTFEELAIIKHAIPNPRLLFCIDTAHAFAAGYDFTAPDKAKEFVTHLSETIGIGSIAAIHANDSKVACGEKKDRHENIGDGKIGMGGFRALMNALEVTQIPWILETPGEDREGPNKQNIDRLKLLRDFTNEGKK